MFRRKLKTYESRYDTRDKNLSTVLANRPNTTATVPGICTFVVFFSVSRPFSRFTLVCGGGRNRIENREEGEMAQTKLGGGRNREKK